MTHVPLIGGLLRRLHALWAYGYSLRWALILRVLLPLLVAMTAVTTLGLRTLETAIENQMQEDVELVARAIRLPISDSLERGEEENVRQALESVFRIGRVYGAYVYDADGDVVAAVGAVNPRGASAEVADRAADGERGGDYEQIEGQEVYSFFEPLTDSGGRIAGLLQVTRRGSDFQDDIGRLRLQAYAFIGVASAVITLLLLVGHRGAIGRHLGNLAASMSRIEGGDRAHRAAGDGPKEVRALSTAFNTMLDSMRSAEQEIAQRRQEQARLEDELRQAEKLAAIGRLAAGVAHELGTPLSVIDGKAQRVLRHTDADSSQHRSLHQIRREVGRMEHIVRQLLEFARTSRHRGLRRVRLHDIASAAATALEDLARERGASIRVDSAAPGPELYADPVRIEQVLVNLLRNALQAGATTVAVAWDERVDGVEVRIEDDGPGIPEQLRPRLFEPFFTTKAVGEGTGLGLAVAHGIITEHGGSIAVEASDQGGARFRLLLDHEARNAEESEGNGEENGR